MIDSSKIELDLPQKASDLSNNSRFMANSAKIVNRAGNVSLAYKGGNPPWHRAGAVLPEKCTDINQALRFAGLGSKHFRKEPAKYNGKNIPGVFAVVDENNEPIDGTSVGNRYTVIQYKEAFEPLTELLEEKGYEIDVCGAINNSSTAWLAVKAGEESLLGHDRLLKTILILTSNDGKSSHQTMPAITRPVCWNTVSHNVTGNKKHKRILNIRHTKNYSDRLNDLKKVFSASELRWVDMKNTFELMAKKNILSADVKRFAVDLFPHVGDYDSSVKIPTRTINRRNEIIRLFEESPGSNLPTAKGTVWGLYNAATHYNDWGRSMKGEVKVGDRWYASSTSLNGIALRDKAAQLSLQLVRS